MAKKKSINERSVMRAGLEALDAAIADTAAALRLAETSEDTEALRGRLVLLKLMRTNLETTLLKRSSKADVTGAIVLTPDQLKSLDAGLAQVKADRRIVRAAVERSDAVIRKVNSLQVLLTGNDPTSDLLVDLGSIGDDPTYD